MSTAYSVVTPPSTDRPTKTSNRWIERYGPWALVTGASDGIGKALADDLARRGLNVVIVARRRAVLEGVAANLRERFGVDVRVIDADLGAVEGVTGVIEATRDLEVGVLVAAAGFGTSGRLLESDLETEAEMLDVNCRASLMMAHAFGRRMARRGRGGVVLLSSIVAFQGVARAANYAATKAYIQTLAEGLRAELKADGIDVLAAAPGPVNSGFADRAGMRLGTALRPEDIAPKILNALGRQGTVRPGWLTKLLSAGLSVPRWMRIRIMRRVMAGMTRQQGVAEPTFPAPGGTT